MGRAENGDALVHWPSGFRFFFLSWVTRHERRRFLSCRRMRIEVKVLLDVVLLTSAFTVESCEGNVGVTEYETILAMSNLYARQFR